MPIAKLGALCTWPVCGCPGECQATEGLRRPPVMAARSAAPPLTSVEGKLDSLNESVATLGLQMSLKADSARVGKVERAVRGVRWQLYILAAALAGAEVWIYWLFGKK